MTSATLAAATTTGAKPNKHRHAANSRGVSTLMYAAQQGDVDRVKKIVHEQSDTLLNRDRRGKTPLHYCSTSDNICAAQAADILVMAAPDLVESRDEDGFTPLHLAVIAGNMPLVTFLLANNADVNAVDNEKHTVVHWAAVCGETAALQAVLAAGAPVSTPDVHGGYPLHYAAQMCGGEKDSNLGIQVLQTLLTHSDIVVSVEDGDGRQPLLWAASAGSAKAVLALIRAGAAIEAADKDGLTALHCAASRGHTDCIDSLLTLCGASPDVIDSNGCTALHYAVTLGHADATALLLAHGADSNRQDRKGRTPAHCGCAKGQFETVKMIASSGANLWLRNARGDLPLHEAAASGRRDLVRWLLDMRPSQVNARNNDGRCPLHLAALNDNADMCKILLDAGAQINPILRTSKNTFMTPLDCALQRGFRSTAKYLQLHGGVPANRLGDLRHNQATTNLQIKDDVTFWGDTSSDSERENGDTTRYNKRIQRKKLISHKYEKRKTSLSGSDPESQKLITGKLDRRRFGEKRNKNVGRTDSAISLEKKSEKKIPSAHIDYTNQITINGKTQINIQNTKEINVENEEKIITNNVTTETAEAISDKEKRPKSAKSVKIKDKSKVDSARKKNQNERPNSKLKQINSNEDSEQNKIKSPDTTKQEVKIKKIQSETSSPKMQELKEPKLADQQSVMSNTSEEVEEHKSLVVEAAVHEPPKTVDNKQENSQKETIDKAVETEDEKISLQSLQFDQTITKVETDSQAENKNSQETTETKELQQENNSLEDDTKMDKPKVEEEPDKENNKTDNQQDDKKIDVENKSEITESLGNEEIAQLVQKPVSDDKDNSEEKLENLESVTADDNQINSQINAQADEPAAVTEKIDEKITNQNENGEESKEVKTETLSPTPETNKTVTESAETIPENQNSKLVDDNKQESFSETNEAITQEKIIENEEADQSADNDTKETVSNEEKIIEKQEILTNNETKITENQEVQSHDNKKIPENQEVPTKIDSESPEEKQKSKKKSHRKKRQASEDQAYEIIYKTLADGEDATDATNQLTQNQEKSKKREKLKPQKTISETKSDESSTDLETESSTSTNATVKEHKSFRILDEKEAEELETKKQKSRVPRKSKSPPKKQRSKSEENKNKTEKTKKSKIPTSLAKSQLSKSDKYLNIPDRKTKSSLESRVPSLPNIHETKDRIKEPPRSESNMSAPLLASAYSDEEITVSESEDEKEEKSDKSSATRRRKLKKRPKTRSAGSDYESSNVIDSGFEPSPRSSKIPKWKNMSERGVNMASVTQSIQSNIRRYHLERKIFQHLLDLKRLQIRAGQHNEAILVKRAIDAYHQSCASTVGAGRYIPEDYSFKSFEKFLYLSLRKLQKNGADYLKGLPESSANPLLCTQSTHRCMHATHAYTGIPCAAYLPKMDHHTIPKIGFTSTQCKPGTGFLPTINPKKAVTLELCHGNDKQVISLPADRLDQNKRYYVTFTVKGSESTPPNEETNSTGHRHSKSD